jgi:hypothetical protein
VEQPPTTVAKRVLLEHKYIMTVDDERTRTLTVPGADVAEADSSCMPAPIPMQKRQSSSNFSSTDISKHYALNNQILAAFDSLYGQHLYQVAYAVGMQFVEMALLKIPKHGYFYSSRHSQERDDSTREAMRVGQMLQHMLQEEMDTRDAMETQKLEKLLSLATEQSNNAGKEQLERDRAQLELEFRETKFCGQWAEYADIINATLCPPTKRPTFVAGHTSSVRSKGDLIDSSAMPPCKPTTGRTLSARSKGDLIHLSPSPSAEVFANAVLARQPSDMALQPPSFLYSSGNFSRSDSDDQALVGPALFTRQTSELELERALWLSGLEVQRADPVGKPRTKSKTEIAVGILGALYCEDFDMLRTLNRIRVTRMKTYQGRLPESINGCTVIAPLLCIHHFHSSWGDHGPDMGLPDATIVQVIDEETPAILPEVRMKLGLTKDALIIPSDVHDYLIDHSLLSPEQFVTVCGGNILEAAHVDDFVQQLESTNGPGKRLEGKKIAATLFFHEHVLTIHKLLRDDGEAWYDWVDSLPAEATLRLPYELDDPDYVPYAVRARCTDEEALKALIRWYACSKFSEENEQYIDMYAWDDHEADFDPRVFQAFIWTEM